MSKSNVKFNKTQLKVCENVEFKYSLNSKLQMLESEYREILELFGLFDHFTEKKFHIYTLCFNEKIIEIKKLLKNTEKRLNYNMVRC